MVETNFNVPINVVGAVDRTANGHPMCRSVSVKYPNWMFKTPESKVQSNPGLFH